MSRKMSDIAQAHATHAARMHHAEQRLADLDSMLHALGVTLWKTDMSLRLVESHVIAESFHGRPIGEFYREAYGLTDADSPPMQAHRDARIGMSVTLHAKHQGEQFALLIEPHWNPEGDIIGTMGMSLRLSVAG